MPLISKSSRGVAYMATSALGFSLMYALVKVASRRLPTGEIMLARTVFTLALSYAMVTRAGLHPWGTQKRKLLLRGLLGFGGLSGCYLALARLPLADATTIQNTTPLVTAFLAYGLLGERVSLPTFLALACGITGVVVIVHPSGNDLDLAGVAIALAGSSCSAIAYVTVRSLVRTEHPLVIVFYFPLVAAPLSLPWALYDRITPTPTELLLLLAIGITTQIGQVFLTMGLAIERAGRALSVGYLQVAFAIGWQFLVFDEPPTLATLGGAALIVAGTLVVAGSSASQEARDGRTA